ncbi:MAG: zinc-binding dehydrogenase [Thermales bacterium]|nr:zinc-binding dehydrogenase [Thermales bacterium]
MKKVGNFYGLVNLVPRFSNVYLSLWTKIFGAVGEHKVKFPLPKNSLEDLEYIKSLLESGEFSPVVDRVYQLEDIVEAYDYVLTGTKVGNVVVKL